MTQEVLKLALDWAEAHGEIVFASGGMSAVNKMNSWVAAIKEALAQPTWVGLSEQDINELKYNLPDMYYWVDVVRATEKRLKEKNT